MGKNVFTIKHEYSNIDFSALTDSELTELIKRAMTEFQNRLSNPVFEKRREERKVVYSPSERQLTFIEKCLSGGYVHASMKDDYKALAKEFSEWFRSKGYPTDDPTRE
ncbi:hypothetical protein [Serratia nevei]|uniref:hypothetical protein n=1 Tax=Serratia nevei TaxID=2703794 RepID=UPI00285CAC10|nr:hypothetical protein [Serratia nevei]MDR8481885.1 hypothetical protein [Serratia nevei]